MLNSVENTLHRFCRSRLFLSVTCEFSWWLKGSCLIDSNVSLAFTRPPCRSSFTLSFNAPVLSHCGCSVCLEALRARLIARACWVSALAFAENCLGKRPQRSCCFVPTSTSVNHIPLLTEAGVYRTTKRGSLRSFWHLRVKKATPFALVQLWKAIVVMCPGHSEMGCIMLLLSEVLSEFRAQQ